MTKRLFFALAGLAVVVLILADVVGRDQVVVAERRGAVIDLERKAFKIALNAQDDLEHEAGPNEATQIQRLVVRTSAQLGGIAVVTDRRGRPIASAPAGDASVARTLTRREARPALRNASTASRTVRVGGTDYEVAEVPIVANQGIVGLVMLAQRSSVLDAAASDRLAFLTPALLIAIGLSVVLALVLARALTRPLGQLVVATRRVARQGSGAPSVEPRGPAELRELADAFNAMSLRVRELIDRQSQFASDVSHQLRTPLTTLGVAVERTRDRGAEGDIAGAGESLAAVQAEVTRLRQLVEGLLVLTRVPLGDAVREPVDVAAIARERGEVWRELAREHGVDLLVRAPVRADALAVVGAVDQIVDNLVDNAVEVAPAGSAIRIDVERADSVVTVSVTDRGPGMTAAGRERAFDRFWRADATGDGIGIGLTIVRDLTEACGGEIELLEAPGGGTRAVLTLELAPGRVTDPISSGAPGAALTTARLRARLRRYLRARDPEGAEALEAEVWLACAQESPDFDGCDECATAVFTMAHERLPVPEPDRPGDAELDAHLLRTLGGLDTTQIAHVLDVRPRTVERLERQVHTQLPVVDGRLVPTPIASRRRMSRAARAGAIAAVAAVVAAGTAAATGSLPDPVQHEVARVLRSVGVHVPDPEPERVSGAAVSHVGTAAAPAARGGMPAEVVALDRGGDGSVPGSTTTALPASSAPGGTTPSGSGNGNGSGGGSANGSGKASAPGQAKQSGNAAAAPGQARQSGSVVPPGLAKQPGGATVPPGQAKKSSATTALPPGQAKKAADAPATPNPSSDASLPPGQAKQTDGAAKVPPGQVKKG